MILGLVDQSRSEVIVKRCACSVGHQDKKNPYQTFVEKHMTWGAILWENSQQLFVYSTRLPRLFVQILLIQSMQKTCKFFPAMQRRYSTFFGRWSIRIVATNWAIERGRGVAYASISSSLVPPSTVSGCGKEVLFSFKWSLRLCVGWSCVVCILFLPFQKLKLLLSSGTFWFACLDVLFGCFSCWIVSDPIRIISKDQERWTFSNQFSLMIEIRMFSFTIFPFLLGFHCLWSSSLVLNETCLDQFENPKLPAQVTHFVCFVCFIVRSTCIVLICFDATLQICDYAPVQPLWLRQSWIYHDLILSTLQLLGYPLG